MLGVQPGPIGGLGVIPGWVLLSTRDYELYRLLGSKLVGGWLSPEVLAITAVLDSVQRARHISGAVAEIGVHHGKFFIGLNLLRRSGERSVAVDVFGDQDLNVDFSGKGDLELFKKNVNRWSSLDPVIIHRGDSTALRAEQLRELAGSDIRLFSVDGGHTAPTVLSDMRLAHSTLAPGGIVIADDVFNQEWPEVLIGTLQFLDDHEDLVPFAIGFNKVFFARAEYADIYRETLRAHFEDKLLVVVKDAHFANRDVVVLIRTPRNRLRVWHDYHH